MFKSAASPASTWRLSKVRDISNCAEARIRRRETAIFQRPSRRAYTRARGSDGGHRRRGTRRLAGTLATDRPKSPWAWRRRSAITVADPLRSYGRFGGFDDRTHPTRILPPAYQDTGLGSRR